MDNTAIENILTKHSPQMASVEKMVEELYDHERALVALARLTVGAILAELCSLYGTDSAILSLSSDTSYNDNGGMSLSRSCSLSLDSPSLSLEDLDDLESSLSSLFDACFPQDQADGEMTVYANGDWTLDAD